MGPDIGRVRGSRALAFSRADPDVILQSVSEAHNNTMSIHG